MGETLPNHAYVDLSLVGTAADGSDSVQCRTDLITCCNSIWGPDRGDWHPPGSAARLPFSNEVGYSGHCTIRWTLYYCIDRTEPLTYYTYSCMYACADIHHAQLLYTLLRDILKVYPATSSSKCVLALSSRLYL